MVIASNVIAIDTYKSLKRNDKVKEKAMEKLSTGYQINRSADNAAGLSISEKMKALIRGVNKATVNTEDAVSMVQIAENALGETHRALLRMRELSVNSATDTTSLDDKEAMQKEVVELTNEINRIGETTEFNGMSLLTGAKSDSRIYEGSIVIEGDDNSLYFQVGANRDETINVSFSNMTAIAIGIAKEPKTALGLVLEDVEIGGKVYQGIYANSKNVINAITSEFEAHSLDITTREGANAAIDVIDAAVNVVSQERSKYGAIVNRLEHTFNSLTIEKENLMAANSRIVDTDIASEMMEFTKSSILVASAQSFLSQAMVMPESTLSLLQDSFGSQGGMPVKHTSSLDIPKTNSNKVSNNSDINTSSESKD